MSYINKDKRIKDMRIYYRRKMNEYRLNRIQYNIYK